jgi:polar amino acid transport system substrate-binding protein
MRFSPLLFLLIWAGETAGEPLRVVTTEMAPFFFQRDGQPRGIECEILQYFARSQNREIEIRWVGSFKDVLPALEKAQADIAAAAITITPEREGRFDFSAPYFPAQHVLVELSRFETRDLASLSGARVGALAGSTGMTALEGAVDVQMVPFDSLRPLFEAVAAGKVRAIVAETARTLLLLEDFDSLRMGPFVGNKRHYGFALRKGSSLKEPLGEHLEKLKKAGIYFRLLEQHFGSKAVEIVRLAKD